MDLDNVIAVDIETVGLIPKVKSREDLHVLSFAMRDSKGDIITKSTNKESDIQKILGNEKLTLVIHNGKGYDEIVLSNIMGYEIKATIIDSLPISYYLYSEREKHGLSEWGEILGVPKPKVEDWENLSYEEYKHRCEEDCKINLLLWERQYTYLLDLYDGSKKDVARMVSYLNMKSEVLQSCQLNPIHIDRKKCIENKEFLEGVVEEKTKELISVMPKVPIITKKSKPKVMFKKDGSYSKAGIEWLSLLERAKLPMDYEGELELIRAYKDPNPSSSDQMKNWLLSLGWKPTLFKDGANGKVPQLRDDDKNLCPNIIKLSETVPEITSLSGLSVAVHRLGYLKGFLKNMSEDDACAQWASGFTRTLRLKHAAPFANLPKPNSTYGDLVRGVMVAPKGYVCVGADLSSIEDKCKQISIFSLDREYVDSMNTKGWDAHLALGVTAGLLTQEESDFYKWYKNKSKAESTLECPSSFLSKSEKEQDDIFHKLDIVRGVCKTGTYSLTYGCGIPKLMEATELPKAEATKLYNGFHKLNWSVKEFAETRYVKTVKQPTFIKLHKNAGGLVETDTADWIYNEFTGCYMYLKNSKDRFSSCNQSFGVKVFDIWCYILMREGIKISGTWHDEQFFYWREDKVDEIVKILNDSVITLNNMFKPPVPIEMDYKIGKTYRDVH